MGEIPVRSHREFLARACEIDLAFAHIDGTEPALAERIGGRTGHFMPPTMLASQLAALEPLAAEEHGIVVPLDMSLEAALESVRQLVCVNRMVLDIPRATDGAAAGPL